MKYTDAQIERLGTAYLTKRLYQENIKVSIPDIDDGVDLIIYQDGLKTGFRATPLQLKCYRNYGFSTDRKYLEISNLHIVYIWHVENNSALRIFVLKYDEAERIVTERRWTRDSKGRYIRTKHTKPLEDSLRPFETKLFNDKLLNC